MKTLPPLNALRVFSVAARHLSMSKAAIELEVSHSAISQQIKLLEEHLATPLFDRNGKRQLKLTAAGHHYAQTLTILFEQLQRATAQLCQHQNPHTLIIGVTANLATPWFLPKWQLLQQQHPELELHLMTIPPTHFPAHVDCAIYCGTTPWPNCESTKLFADELIAVCSPALFRNQDYLDLKNDYAQYKYIYVTTDESKNDWTLWFQKTGLPKQREKNWLYFPNNTQALQAARNGLGILLTHKHFVSDELQTENLKMAVSIAVTTNLVYYFATSKQNNQRKNIKTTLNLLQK